MKENILSARDYYNQLEAELLKVANKQKTEFENITKNVTIYYDSTKRAVVFGGV